MPPPMSPALLEAAAATAHLDNCTACKDPENQGLCHSDHCRQAVLPVLRESSLKKDAHSGPWHEEALVALAAFVETPKSEHAERMAAQSRRSAIAHGRSPSESLGIQLAWGRTVNRRKKPKAA